MPSYDWEKIRQEYITDPTASFRKLAAKHGIASSTLTDRAVKERWVDQRNQYRSKAGAKFEEAMLNGAASDAENILKARKILTMRALEMAQTAVRPSDIINLTNALQILAKMTGVQSDLDTQEQKARIASIEARAGVQEEEEGGGAILIPEKGWDDE